MGEMVCIENKTKALNYLKKSDIEHIFSTGFNTLAAIVLNSIYSIYVTSTILVCYWFHWIYKRHAHLLNTNFTICG